ncbi:MAG: DUF362 domain-containing protein [Bacteroidales bacterium]|nr:DUF362 domain-containing protein [Bacteroidales bacterium]
MKKTWGWVALIVVAFSAICWDLATSDQYASVAGTFKNESEFDVVSGATTKVAIVPSDYEGLASQVSRTVDPDYEQIEAMVRKAIELQGGLDWVIEKGDKVMLKVNLVGGNIPSGYGENTDVRVVKAVVKIIHDHAAGDVEIVIAEGTARINDNPAVAGSVWENSGYTDLLTDPDLDTINFRLLNLNQSFADLVEVSLGNKATAAPHNDSYYVHKEELEADVYISIPVLKIHNTGITCVLKNQIGTAPGAYYGYNKESGPTLYHNLFHDVNQRRWTDEEIVDFSSIAGIDFVVVDAIMTLESYKTYKGYNQVRFNTIVAGADPVAVDHVCTKLFCLNPDDIDHIVLAEKVGLGTNDAEKIEVVGATIDATKKNVAKNQESNGLFGRSNRTWILSQPFTGSDISTEYIAGEASLVPEAGKNGWSQPVYFFDDRIDLISYYNDPVDVVSYAFTCFSALKEEQAQLWLGYDEGIIVYLNGEKVYSFTGTTTFGDKDLVKVKPVITVKEGENTLLVKTYHKYADYSFTLNICENISTSDAGDRLAGIKFYTNAGQPNALPQQSLTENVGLSVYPNPVDTKATFAFNLPQSGKTSLMIYDLNGRLIMNLMDANLTEGSHTFDWQLNGDGREKIKSGTFLCVLKSGNYSSKIKIIVR